MKITEISYIPFPFFLILRFLNSGVYFIFTAHPNQMLNSHVWLVATEWDSTA